MWDYEKGFNTTLDESEKEEGGRGEEKEKTGEGEGSWIGEERKREKEKEWVDDQVGIEEERKAKMEFWNPKNTK